MRYGHPFKTSPGVDVLEQLGQHPREIACVRDISGSIFLVDDGAPARGLMQWGTAGVFVRGLS